MSTWDFSEAIKNIVAAITIVKQKKANQVLRNWFCVGVFQRLRQPKKRQFLLTSHALPEWPFRCTITVCRKV
jgi:hypothetical protein